MTAAATRWIVAVALRLAGFAVLWWALSEGENGMWSYGAVVVPLVTAVSLMLLRPGARPAALPGRAWAVVALLVWFGWQAFRGGVDVARRAVRRPVDVQPGVVEYRLGIDSVGGRVAVADFTSLMPGTLSVDLVDGALYVHTLDTSMPVRERLADLERRVARVLGS